MSLGIVGRSHYSKSGWQLASGLLFVALFCPFSISGHSIGNDDAIRAGVQGLPQNLRPGLILLRLQIRNFGFIPKFRKERQGQLRDNSSRNIALPQWPVYRRVVDCRPNPLETGPEGCPNVFIAIQFTTSFLCVTKAPKEG